MHIFSCLEYLSTGKDFNLRSVWRWPVEEKSHIFFYFQEKSREKGKKKEKKFHKMNIQQNKASQVSWWYVRAKKSQAKKCFPRKEKCLRRTWTFSFLNKKWLLFPGWFKSHVLFYVYNVFISFFPHPYQCIVSVKTKSHRYNGRWESAKYNELDFTDTSIGHRRGKNESNTMYTWWQTYFLNLFSLVQKKSIQ